jgi:hypothetical protein
MEIIKHLLDLNKKMLLELEAVRVEGEQEKAKR